MGVVQKFAIYSNDLRLVRQMMSANRGQSLKDDQMRDLFPLLGNGAAPPVSARSSRDRAEVTPDERKEGCGLAVHGVGPHLPRS